LWREVRDLALLSSDAQAQVWRLSVPPASGGALARALSDKLGAEWLLDWGGGLVWLAVPARITRPDVPIREAIGTAGHATLIRAPADVREQIACFHPEPAAVAALAARIKHAFDPHGILNPGRM
jgi:glycolate oxidase FAD binding subunit